VGDVLPPWSPGMLDLHQITTGHGNAAFFRFPDGTTMLLDAGNAGDGVAYTEPRPDASQSPGEWISRYIAHMVGGSNVRLDYAVLTHFHDDHMGGITPKSRPAAAGDYLLSGITEVGSIIPIGMLIDRGWPNYDYITPPSDAMFTNYRKFVASQIRSRNMQVARAEAGRADQIIQVRDPARFPGFEVRVVAVNNRVWTGKANETVTRFPAVESISVQEDRPTENMCSIALRFRYGRFDYFTGGDIPGYPVPGGPAWHDVETAIAKAIGPTDVHVVNHHGSIEEENPFFLSTLRSRVMVLPSWSPTHPSQDVIKRMLSTRIYAEPRDIFAVLLRDVTKASIGPRAKQVASDHGHVVIRVEPGGDRYWVIVLDDTAETYRVTSVHGPYASS
jgi:Metallo-beta-lactamase superfamily